MGKIYSQAPKLKQFFKNIEKQWWSGFRKKIGLPSFIIITTTFFIIFSESGEGDINLSYLP